MKRLIAVTGCPTGIAHTYMAAEALQKAAKAKGVELKVETRGATGVENRLTSEDIRQAHAVILTSDVDAEEERFRGKPVLRKALADAIKDGERLIAEALALPPAVEQTEEQEAFSESASQSKKESRVGFYKHLMNGVSFMIPLVVAGGLIIALSFTFGINAAEEEGSLASQLMLIGGGSAFALMVPVLAGFIAFSIADKAGLAPGLVGGMLASHTEAGFLGGIIAGFIAGYLVRWMKQAIRLPRNLEGLKPILIIPLLATLAVGLLMVYVIGSPVKGINDALTAWLQGLGTGNAVLMGLLLGAMMAVDMGGPVNKAAYTFGVGLLASDIYGPMAAVMAAGMTPPLGIWLATLLAKRKFNSEEREAGKAAGILGISFITEGAIPFAAADPFRVIPACIVGSAVTGALAMGLGSTLRAPHGGIFVLPIPNAVGNLGMFILALVVGMIVTALLLWLLKKDVVHDGVETQA